MKLYRCAFLKCVFIGLITISHTLLTSGHEEKTFKYLSPQEKALNSMTPQGKALYLQFLKDPRKYKREHGDWYYEWQLRTEINVRHDKNAEKLLQILYLSKKTESSQSSLASSSESINLSEQTSLASSSESSSLKLH